jgi:hypothetical protein
MAREAVIRTQQCAGCSTWAIGKTPMIRNLATPALAPPIHPIPVAGSLRPYRRVGCIVRSDARYRLRCQGPT